MPKLWFSTAALVLLAACATPTGNGDGDGVAALEGSGDEELVCRVERQIGSRMGVRVCRTREQIEEQRRLDEEALDRNRATGPEAPPLPQRDTGGGLGGPN